MTRREDLERAERNLERAVEALGKERRIIDAVRARIEKMYEPHTHPVPWDGLRLGNSLPSRWYCDECRKQWPCPTFNELRELYSITFGGDGEPQQPVQLGFIPTNKVAL